MSTKRGSTDCDFLDTCCSIFVGSSFSVYFESACETLFRNWKQNMSTKCLSADPAWKVVLGRAESKETSFFSHAKKWTGLDDPLRQSQIDLTLTSDYFSGHLQSRFLELTSCEMLRWMFESPELVCGSLQKTKKQMTGWCEVCWQLAHIPHCHFNF